MYIHNNEKALKFLSELFPAFEILTVGLSEIGWNINRVVIEMKAKNSSATSLHQRILADIEKRIVSGDWPPGFRLPFEVDLARSYHVSRMTVNKVLTKLVDAGLIERHRKTGSFVSQPQGQSAILEIQDIETEVLSLKQKYSFKLEKVL